MAASASFRQLQVIRPHVPLIKFKKSAKEGVGHFDRPAPMVAATKTEKPTTVVPRPALQPLETVLEDYQLPLRYRRQLLTQEEIDCINMGGAIDPQTPQKKK